MHKLLAHPLFEERPASEILEPFGFEVKLNFNELPTDEETPEIFALYCKNPEAFINEQEHTPPAGFTEIARFETEDGDIVFVSVRPKTVFAQLVLDADGECTGATTPMKDIYVERQRQKFQESFSAEHDDYHMKGQLAAAAEAYAGIAAIGILEGKTDTSTMLTSQWPFGRKWWKPTTPRRDLVKAGALILAEIERLDRAAAKAKAAEDVE